jgi:hypothetical protein
MVCGRRFWIFPKAARQQAIELGGDAGQLAGKTRLLVDECGKCRGFRVATEWPDAGQHLIEQHTVGEDVGPRIDRQPLGLFGRHVGGGSDDRTLARHRCLDCGHVLAVIAIRDSRKFRETKVQNLYTPLWRDHHVAGFEIAMDNAARVRGGDRIRDVNRVVQRLVQTQPAFRNDLIELATLDQLHHEEIRADIVERADVGMIQRSDQTGFTGKAFAEVAGRELQGDHPIEARVAGRPHFAHPAPPDRLNELVRPEHLGIRAG